MEALECQQLPAPILPSSAAGDAGMNEKFYNIKQKGEQLRMTRIPKEGIKLIQKHDKMFDGFEMNQ